MTSFTYKREPLDNTRRGICPSCLKDFNVVKSGAITRHGWEEAGRIVGEIGNGHQWGDCPGKGMRPLEETDIDAIRVLEGMALQIELSEKKLEKHENVSFASYSHSFTREAHKHDTEKTKAVHKFFAGRTDIETKIQDTRLKQSGARVHYAPAHRYTIDVPRGHKGLTLVHRIEYSGMDGTYFIFAEGETFTPGMSHLPGFDIPSWETLRQRHITSLKDFIEEVKARRKALTEAIEFHKENPSRGIEHVRR